MNYDVRTSITSDRLVYFGTAAVVAVVVGLMASTGILGGNPRYWPLTIVGLFWLAAAWRLGFRLAGVPLTWRTWRNFTPAMVSMVIFVAVAWTGGWILRLVGLIT